MKRFLAALLAACALAPAALAAEPACDSLTPALIGGPVPSAKSDTAVIRWLGGASYEVAYRGKVYLFDTFYERPQRTRPIGFTVDQIKRADAIFIGHAHFDHISDVGPVSRQTGAPVYGAAISADEAIKLGAPAAQVHTVKDGDVVTLGDVQVDVALAQHSTIEPGLLAAHKLMYDLDELRPLSPEEAAQNAAVQARGTFDPRIQTQGTLAFALVLPGGFSIVLVDSAGPVTPGVKALAAKLGHADVAIVAYQPHVVAEQQIAATWPFIELFSPSLYLPSHHDHSWGAWLDLGVEPLLMKLRDERPQTAFVAPLYRSAICVGTAGAARGKVLSVKY